MSYIIKQLNNGLQWVHHPKTGKVSHMAANVKVGSRYETDQQQGMAHFIEHTLFKGTTHRSNYQIINHLDNVGAALNAFTTKEDTTVYASFSNEYFKRAADLISDILFFSNFPEDEVQKEKNVVIDEIGSYKDNNSEWIIDEFDKILFENHPLGRNLLGTKKSVRNFKIHQIKDFYNKYYNPKNVVISTFSELPYKKIEKIIYKYFEIENSFENITSFEKISNYSPQNITEKVGRHQAHVVIGNRAYSAFDTERYAFSLLNNIIGGPAMNSIMSMALRERNGIAYNLESNYSSYADTGSFTLYFGTDDSMLKKAFDIVFKEFNKLKNNKLSSTKLHNAKKQIGGQLALMHESSQFEALAAAKAMATYNKVEGFEEICKKIDQITAEQVLEVANQILDDKTLSVLTYKNNRN